MAGSNRAANLASQITEWFGGVFVMYPEDFKTPKTAVNRELFRNCLLEFSVDVTKYQMSSHLLMHLSREEALDYVILRQMNRVFPVKINISDIIAPGPKRTEQIVQQLLDYLAFSDCHFSKARARVDCSLNELKAEEERRRKILHLQSELNNIVLQTDQLHKDREEMKLRVEAVKKGAYEWQKSQMDCEQKLNKYNLSIEEKQKKVIALTIKTNEIEGQIAAMKKAVEEREKLADALIETNALAQELSEMREKIQKLEHETSSTKGDIELVNEIVKLWSTIPLSEVDKARETLKKDEADIERLMNNVDMIKENIKGLESRILSLKDDKKVRTENHKQIVSSQKERIEECKNELHSEQYEIAHLEELIQKCSYDKCMEKFLHNQKVFDRVMDLIKEKMYRVRGNGESM